MEELQIARYSSLGDTVISLPDDGTSDAWLAEEGGFWTLYIQDARGVNNAYPLTSQRIGALLKALAYVAEAQMTALEDERRDSQIERSLRD